MRRLALLSIMAFFAASAEAAGLEVANGWIRLLPAGLPAAGYFEVRNTTSTPAQLVGASSPAFGVAMLHKTAEDKGRSTMMHLDEVEVPAAGRLVFRPGGYHLMLMHPAADIKVGGSVPITLEFGAGIKITSQFEVRGPSGTK